MHYQELPRMEISQVIRQRLVKANAPYLSTDNIAEFLLPGELEALQAEVETHAQAMLTSMVVDTSNDHNTKDTAKRLAKMYLTEVFAGRYVPRPTVTEFPNAKHLDELYVVGPIQVNSACSHHLVPIVGKIWIGIQPSDKVMGLSKFHRISEWIMRRPQIQEEATISLADEIEKTIHPMGLGVVFKAKHFCCSWRGVGDQDSLMTTSVVRGSIRESPSLKKEFFDLIREMQ